MWPELVLDMYDGDYTFAARGAMAIRSLRIDDPMHFMMDCASGITRERASRYTVDPAMALIGDPSFEYNALCDVWNAPDLGDRFRSPVESDIPTLMVHGTWDMSTPIENAREVAATLRDVRFVEVIGGSHGALYNLYNYWGPARERIGAFLRGEPAEFPETVTVPPVQFEQRASDS